MYDAPEFYTTNSSTAIAMPLGAVLRPEFDEAR
jgi:hypothetical protein